MQAHKFLDGDDAGGIQMAGALQPQDDDAQVRVTACALDLRAEEIRRTEEEFPFDVDDGNGGIGPHTRPGSFSEISLLVELILDQRGLADFAQIEHHGHAYTCEDGHMQRHQKRGRQGD
jgi:hypothetical protein